MGDVCELGVARGSDVDADMLTEAVAGDMLTEVVAGDMLTEVVAGDMPTEAVVGDMLTEAVVGDMLTEVVVGDMLFVAETADSMLAADDCSDDAWADVIVCENGMTGVVCPPDTELVSRVRKNVTAKPWGEPNGWLALSLLDCSSSRMSFSANSLGIVVV
ncbi:hypothetical protein EV181_004867 [Coemansia sp. RSA 532]|nr:hypothetical protein LPJ67_005978 [Coemansia sp. RSA 1938]KAJ2183484.1 hypothetical protein EV181_004867 [Coemansia sp. RSA 532]